MTLFELVSDAPEFPAVLERYYHSQRDDLTLEIVQGFPRSSNGVSVEAKPLGCP